MSDAPGTTTSTEAPAGTTPPEAPAGEGANVTPPPAPNAAPAGSESGNDAGSKPKVETFDAEYVSKLRDEAAEARVKGNEKATAAADKARKDLIEKLGKELGLIEDNTKAPDAEALTAQIAKEQAAARKAQVDLAVFRGAPKAGGDVDALLDSSSFKATLKELDPTSATFTADVEAAIKAAVTANPKLASAPVVPARSGGDTSTGDTESTGQLNREQLQKMSPSERLAAHKAGRTKALLS